MDRSNHPAAFVSDGAATDVRPSANSPSPHAHPVLRTRPRRSNSESLSASVLGVSAASPRAAYATTALPAIQPGTRDPTVRRASEHACLTSPAPVPGCPSRPARRIEPRAHPAATGPRSHQGLWPGRPTAGAHDEQCCSDGTPPAIASAPGPTRHCTPFTRSTMSSRSSEAKSRATVLFGNETRRATSETPAGPAETARRMAKARSSDWTI